MNEWENEREINNKKKTRKRLGNMFVVVVIS